MWLALKRRFAKPALDLASSQGYKILAATGVASFVLLVRAVGLLQGVEWAMSDLFLRSRPEQELHNRLLVVGIDEADLRQLGWPIPDAVLADVIRRLDESNPRVIGLDLYRDLAMEPGHEDLVALFEQQENLIGIEKLEPDYESHVSPPQALKERGAVGFNNTLVDADGVVRRSYLFLRDHEETLHRSFALKLALMYLEQENITPIAAPSGEMQLGEVVIPQFEANAGPYVRADDRGYQFMVNYRGRADLIPTVSLREVLNGEVPEEDIRDRVVLIGSTAASLRDVFITPYSRSLLETQTEVPGVLLQAEFVGQILDAALEGRRFISLWPTLLEIFWIVLWAWVGALISWQLQSVRRSLAALVVALLLLMGTAYWAYSLNLWIPVIPPILSLTGATAMVVSYLAYLSDELRRSKEFLQSIINTIPDPIFVKDTELRSVVLNQAYSELVGYPLNTLLNRSEFEIFPQEQAQAFRQEDESVLQTGCDRETEETLTDAQGNLHILATKRSLHSDGAGNHFLIGVIRDITERKLLEDQLKQVAAELAQSNAALKQDANHDELTGLPNRKLFQERLKQSIEWAEGHQKLVGVMFLDLDGFKEVNDTLGHASGDILLQHVAKRLSGSLRGSDTVARLGGDEFTVILPGIPSIADAERVAQKIVKTLSEPFELEEGTVSVTTSLGICLYPTHGHQLDALIHLADEAMFDAKKQGKNCYCIAHINPECQP
ncbi:CHASE2 domain-containing protein [Geitlerinema sp. P-1104]|uniref:CHASE2 domain-containing protein n=1 Tax=Geitlerinema sp. P-1104 TaxID=2546230 RepID=UPI0014769047|nr:CHASE2 domain-containing protein [Geitlerinema sp. P-1104]NMG58916.1 CHASE2 domain-containing protein [Geitlerinema sp. P-1104]